MQDRCHDRRLRIAETEIAAIDACPCGVLQLHLGTFSIRFTVDGLTKVHQTLTQALERLGAAPPNLDAPHEDHAMMLAPTTKRGAA